MPIDLGAGSCPAKHSPLSVRIDEARVNQSAKRSKNDLPIRRGLSLGVKPVSDSFETGKTLERYVERLRRVER